MVSKNLNRLKVVLAEKQRTNKWLAEQMGKDLVEIAPSATPPVCKIIDFGKFRYQQTKKEKENKREKERRREEREREREGERGREREKGKSLTLITCFHSLKI